MGGAKEEDESQHLGLGSTTALDLSEMRGHTSHGRVTAQVSEMRVPGIRGELKMANEKNGKRD